MASFFTFSFFTFLLLSASFSNVYASSLPSKIVNGYVSDVINKAMKWFWSLQANTKPAIVGKPMMKYESGYTVETVFDGSKLGVEPHTVEVLPNGELLILDSANSNLYKMSSSLSLYSRPKLVAGSAEGFSGHIDGRTREAMMNHPKGLTVDDRGNIYIADTDNMAIRKISDSGVTTLAGGKLGRGGGHVDGPSEDAKFSNDFDVVYVGSSCSLLIIDRGNRAIREIQLHFDDCAYQYESGFPLGIALLVAAGFFGYMLALLQRRVGAIVTPQNDELLQKAVAPNLYQKPLMGSVRPPLIPTEGEQEKQEETFFGSLRRLLAQTGESAADILGGVLPGFRKRPTTSLFEHPQLYQQQQKYSNPWPVQDSYVIRDDDEAPTVEANPTPRKTYAFMSKDAEKMQQLRQSRAFYSGLDGNFQQQQQDHHQQQQQQQQQTQKQQHHHRYHSSIPQTYYEQSSEKTNEIVFGAVQEQGGKQETIINPFDSWNSSYDHRNIHYRVNSMSYGQGY
ncbi:hypothetical protein Leryth_021180 [Lithospermum erythrorhizon]|nr:hypothetical protein Leryth_021180 [Lithospermum erythrorhizon]